MKRERALQFALVLFGLLSLFGLFPLMMYVWPSGWRWQPHQSEYEQMIIGIYATLGVFLLMAARRPSQHRSLIAFAAWSSLVHGVIMAVQALRSPAERGHLFGDVPALIIIWITLIVLAPAKPEDKTRAVHV